MEVYDVIIALGSNTNPRRNMERAMAALRGVMPDIVFTELVETEPVGMKSSRFLNCMARATAAVTLEQLTRCVKDIERMLGDDGHGSNVVNMDIDILLYGDRKFHTADWERDYIKRLYDKMKSY